MKNARLELAFVLLALCALSAASTAFVYRSGWTLYYGDAEAHLNIARRILDSRTPGYDQLGTVWLPLPHLLAMPFAAIDRWWRNGLAGAIPSSACFVVAGAFLYAAIRFATSSTPPAIAGVALFALNPNLLYLQATPMTEPVFLAAFMAMLYFTIRFRATQSWAAVVGAGLASFAASLSRYEGWFLIPFVAIYFAVASKRRGLVTALIYGGLASVGPLFWLAHNWWLYGNPLEFYNGPFSAMAIYHRALDQHLAPYPGDHDWAKAIRYFSADARLCAGWGTVLAAAAGLLAFAVNRKRLLWPAMAASLVPVFYLFSMHSGGTPIFVPTLWPNTYYNTRYGLAALPLLAIAAGNLVLLGSGRRRAILAGVAVLLGVGPWLVRPNHAGWITWKESQVNSEARRAWTRESAEFLQKHYRLGSGIFTSFGDLIGIFRDAGIPIREALHDGNVPQWMSAVRRPDLFLHTRWALAISGDQVANALERAKQNGGPRYDLVRAIRVPAAPVIEIYRRIDP